MTGFPKRLTLTLLLAAMMAPVFLTGRPGWLLMPEYDALGPGFVKVTPQSLLFLAVAVALCLAAALCAVHRWRLLLRELLPDPGHIPLVRMWFASSAAGFFLPGILGRDLVRLVLAGKATGCCTRSAAALLADRVLALLAFMTLLPLLLAAGIWAIHADPAKLRLGIGTLLLTALSVLGAITLFRAQGISVIARVLPVPPSFRELVDRLAAAVAMLADNPAMLARAFAWGLAAQVLLAAAGAAILAGLNAGPMPMLEAAAGGGRGAPRGGGGASLLARRVLDLALLDGIPSEYLGKQLFPSLAAETQTALTALTPWLTLRGVPALAGLAMLLTVWGKTGAVAGAPRPLVSPDWDRHDPAWYRRFTVLTLLAGLGGGLIGGALTGLSESAWLYMRWLAGAEELHMFWWGALFYGLLFTGLGMAVAAGLAYLSLALHRFPSPGTVFSLSLGATVSAALLVIGRFRFARDVLGDHPLETNHMLVLLGTAALLFIMVAALGCLMLRNLRLRPVPAATLILGGFAVAVSGGAVFGHIAAEPSPPVVFDPPVDAEGPPVILIVADTLRADFLSLYREGALAKTPHLDAFAEDSILFLESYSQAAWTKPSFGTFFTGLYPGVHGALGKADVLDPAHPTIAEHLAEHGYYTAGLPNNRNLLPYYGLERGFLDYRFLLPNLYFGATFTAERLAIYEVLRRVRIGLMAPYIDIDHFYRPAFAVNEAATEWYETAPRPEDAPYFLYIHYMDPHDPFMIRDRSGEGFALMRLGMDPDPDEFRKPMIYAYIDEIEYLDAALGAFFDDLKDRGLYDEAAIIFTSDHGEEFYEHGGWFHGPALYDEVTHVPLLIKLPDSVGGGTVNTHLARHLDIPATIAGFAGLPPLPDCQGTPLVDLEGRFLNEGTTHSYAVTDFLETVAESVRTLEWKYIAAEPENPRDLDPEELYRIDEDPEETENLADDALRKLDRMRQLLHEVSRKAEGPGIAPPPATP